MALRCAQRSAGPDRGPRGLLRTLRGLSGACAAARGQPRAGRPDARRRPAPRDRAAGPPRRAARRAARSWTPWSRRSRVGRVRCRCSRRRCSSSGADVTADVCGSSTTSAPAASTAPSRGSPSGAFERLVRGPAAGRPARAAAPRAATATVTPSSVAASRLERTRAATSVAEVLDVLADARLVTVEDGDGRGRARGAPARMAAPARVARSEDAEARRLHQHLIRGGAATGWPRDATAAELYRGARLAAALDWRTTPRGGAQRAASGSSSPRAGPRPRRESAAPATGESPAAGAAAAVSRRCWLSPLVAGARRGLAAWRRRDDAALTADAQRLGAEAVSATTTSTRRCCSRAPVWTSTDSAVTRSQLLSVLMRTPQALGDARRRPANRCSTCRSARTGGCIAVAGSSRGGHDPRYGSPPTGRPALPGRARRTSPTSSSRRTDGPSRSLALPTTTDPAARWRRGPRRRPDASRAGCRSMLPPFPGGAAGSAVQSPLRARTAAT